MKSYTRVSRKTVGEDRIAICPKFGCAQMTRVKPLRFRFIGFGKYPKCKVHHIPLVYTNERIGDIVDAALACFFDISALPSKNLIDEVKSRFPNEFESFLKGWIYCITIGRGAPIISRYMDSISNAYLKQLTNNQIKRLKKDKLTSKTVEDTIKNGMDEISTHYTRILTHLRTHSEIFVESEKLNPLSENLRKYLYNWQNSMVKNNEILNSPEIKNSDSLERIKKNYDSILNVKICRCLIGLDPEIKEVKKSQLTAFDIFSAYKEFYTEGLTIKFTKSDINNLLSEVLILKNNQSKDLKKKNGLTISNDVVKSLENHQNRTSYLELKSLIESKKGKLISTEYVNNTTKVVVECEFNHRFQISPKNLKRGQWCRDCYDNRRGLSQKAKRWYLEEIRKIAELYNVELISSFYTNSDTPLEFKCLICNTNFKDSYRLIRSRKTIKLKCPHCDPEKSEEDYYLEIKAIVESKQGTLISKKYTNSVTKVKVKCNKGHIWSITPNDLKSGFWCKKCYTLEVREKIRNEVESIITSKGGSLKNIDFSQKHSRVYIECEQSHRWWAKTSNIKEGKWCIECYLDRANRYSNLKSYIETRGGKLLSLEYKSSKDKVVVECKDKHRWNATPDNILNGNTWCPRCFFKENAEKFRKYALTSPFKFKKENIFNRDISTKIILEYLSNIADFYYPYQEFIGNYNRASKLKFVGTLSKKAKISIIQDFLLKHNVLMLKDNLKVIDMIRNFYNDYLKLNNNKKPYHPPILNHLFNNHPASIAIEVPVWRYIKSLDIYFTGHIDILLLRENTLYICDFKQRERQLIYSIPQVMAYGILLKEHLLEINKGFNYNFICALFTKDSWVCFDPLKILPIVLNFLRDKTYLIGNIKGSSLYQDIIRYLT